LGVILYELLTGALPFDPKTLREGDIDRIRQVIREEEPKTPSIHLTSISGEESINGGTAAPHGYPHVGAQITWRFGLDHNQGDGEGPVAPLSNGHRLG